jgi:hypothetical protein
MTREFALSLVQVLPPMIDPSAILIDYTTMKVCTMWYARWYGGLAGGMTWTVEMEAIEADWLTRNKTKH